MHFAELYRFAYRYVRSVETAKDLVGDAFLRLWEQRGQVDSGGPAVRSYLYTVVRYRALDHLRHRRVEDRWRLECAAAVIPDYSVPTRTPDHEFMAREVAAALQKAVDALPRRQREVFQLRWWKQASHDEIANTLGISPKTVAVHLGRAIQRLRVLLAQAL